MINKVKFVSIPVTNQDRALQFYTQKLGFTVLTDQPFDDSQRWIELRVPKSDTSVVLFTAKGEEKRVGTFMNLAFESNDVASTYKTLKDKGVSFDGEPKKEHWGTFVIMKDSEGNSI
jgi:catechol 2,3-dioxygenase-like lactoylglutathione lyase family enzyme